MSLPRITIEGVIIGEPELRFTPSGAAALNIRIKASDRRKNDAGEYEDDGVLWISATLWRDEAESAAEVLHNLTEVIVTGKLVTREFQTREGEKRSVTELKFPVVAPAITRRQSVTVTKGAGGRTPQHVTDGFGSAPAEEPQW